MWGVCLFCHFVSQSLFLLKKMSWGIIIAKCCGLENCRLRHGYKNKRTVGLLCEKQVGASKLQLCMDRSTCWLVMVIILAHFDI